MNDKLKEKREQAGLSQSQLAEKSGISLRSIQAYEQGRRSLEMASLKTAKALTDAIGCDIEELF